MTMSRKDCAHKLRLGGFFIFSANFFRASSAQLPRFLESQKVSTRKSATSATTKRSTQ